MGLKMFSEDLRFIAQTNTDLFAIKVRHDNQSVNYLLSDEEVRELQMLCEYHLQNKKSEKEE